MRKTKKRKGCHRANSGKTKKLKSKRQKGEQQESNRLGSLRKEIDKTKKELNGYHQTRKEKRENQKRWETREQEESRPQEQRRALEKDIVLGTA